MYNLQNTSIFYVEQIKKENGPTQHELNFFAGSTTAVWSCMLLIAPRSGKISSLSKSLTRSNPLTWPMGKSTHTDPGSDRIVRVVAVKTFSGIYSRPVSKLVQLPSDI